MKILCLGIIGDKYFWLIDYFNGEVVFFFIGCKRFFSVRIEGGYVVIDLFEMVFRNGN